MNIFFSWCVSITSIIQSSFGLWRFGVISKPKTTLKTKKKHTIEEALGLVKILEASHNNKIIQTKSNNNKKKWKKEQTHIETTENLFVIVSLAQWLEYECDAIFYA